MALLAVKQMRSHFDQAECYALSNSKCYGFDIAFDGNRRVAVSWCVVRGGGGRYVCLRNRQKSHGNMWGITVLVKLYVYW
jgi:hypothetical protein